MTKTMSLLGLLLVSAGLLSACSQQSKYRALNEPHDYMLLINGDAEIPVHVSLTLTSKNVTTNSNFEVRTPFMQVFNGQACSVDLVTAPTATVKKLHIELQVDGKNTGRVIDAETGPGKSGTYKLAHETVDQ